MSRLQWSLDQMKEIGYGPQDGVEQQAVHTSVEALLKVFLEQQHTDRTREETLRIFNDLANERALVRATENEIWIPARLGDIEVSNVVRTRADAFPGAAGRWHNNRVGVVVAVRRGDIHVAYRDGKYKGSNADAINVTVDKLEKRVL